MEQGNYPIYQFPGICVFSKFIEIGSRNRYSAPKETTLTPLFNLFGINMIPNLSRIINRNQKLLPFLFPFGMLYYEKTAKDGDSMSDDGKWELSREEIEERIRTMRT